MHRRNFLATLGGGVAAGVATGRPASAAGGAALISTYVSNVEQGHPERPLPGAGCRLALRIDESRTWDPQSVQVCTADGAPVGYLPSIHGRIIAPLLAGGFAAEARVTSAKSTPRPAIRIEIALQTVRIPVPT